MWILAMFQTSIVPHEAVEKYGTKFGRHPVGTGPFTMAEADWRSGQSMTFRKNPNYHACYYPEEHMPEDEAFGLHLAAGTRLPIADTIEFIMFVQDQPMWLQFLAGKIDYTQVPSEYFSDAFLRRSKKLKSKYRNRGMQGHPVALLDFIFYGFNMDDPLLGGYSDKSKKLRQAISLALDWDERNEAFYNNMNVVYSGMIPPGLDGHPQAGDSVPQYRGLDLDRARQRLADAGYPGGNGLPVLEYYTSRGRNIQEQTEMLTAHLSKIGVRINPHLVDFSTLIEAVTNKKAPFFSFAWGSDYPDAENNLALFYGPNSSPGSNHFNYKNSRYDKLYEKILVMSPSPERTTLIKTMRNMVIEDAPYCGAMARTRFYLQHPRLKNFKPTEDFHNWPKYLDIDESRK